MALKPQVCETSASAKHNPSRNPVAVKLCYFLLFKRVFPNVRKQQQIIYPCSSVASAPCRQAGLTPAPKIQNQDLSCRVWVPSCCHPASGFQRCGNCGSTLQDFLRLNGLFVPSFLRQSSAWQNRAGLQAAVSLIRSGFRVDGAAVSACSRGSGHSLFVQSRHQDPGAQVFLALSWPVFQIALHSVPSPGFSMPQPVN